MKDITLISCSYNTPVVTTTMLQSWMSLHPEVPILISEHSTDNSTREYLNKVRVPFISKKGELHGPGVNNLLDIVETRYALLVDTDVVFLKDHTSTFEGFKQIDAAIMGEIVGDRGGKLLYKRVNPWHCFIDIQKLKLHNIKFYDPIRQKLRGERRYDIGSSMFEDIRNAKLSIANFLGNNYLYKHYEGMSWHTTRYGSADGDIDTDPSATHSNYGLYSHGKYVNELYLTETQYIRNQPLLYYAA